MMDELYDYCGTEEFQYKYNAAMEEIENYILELAKKVEQEESIPIIKAVEHRIKKTDSIISKLDRKKLEHNPEIMENKIKDIAGVRLICFYTNQIYILSSKMIDEGRYHIIKIKDYISNPKKNGYQGYHIIVEVPVSYKGMTYRVKVELQLRTVIMDAWISVESKAWYKNKKDITKETKKKIAAFTKTLEKQDKIIEEIMLGINE